MEYTAARCGDPHWASTGELLFCTRKPGHGDMHHCEGLLWSEGRKRPYRRQTGWFNLRKRVASLIDPGEWPG